MEHSNCLANFIFIFHVVRIFPAALDSPRPCVFYCPLLYFPSSSSSLSLSPHIFITTPRSGYPKKSFTSPSPGPTVLLLAAIDKVTLALAGQDEPKAADRLQNTRSAPVIEHPHGLSCKVPPRAAEQMAKDVSDTLPSTMTGPTPSTHPTQPL